MVNNQIPISYYISVDVERHLHLFFYNKGDRRSDVILIETYKMFSSAKQSAIPLLYSVLTFEIDGRIVYLELTPQSGKSNYGKEILFEGIEELHIYN